MPQGVRRRPDERRLDAWRAFLTAHQAVLRQLEQELRDERDLPLAWYEVLLHLSRAPEGRLRMHELADNILLTPSGLTRLADRMEQAGLIERVTCPTDRRGVWAAVTKQGRRRLREAAPVHLRGIDEHFAQHLTDDEVDVLVHAFAKLAPETQ